MLEWKVEWNFKSPENGRCSLESPHNMVNEDILSTSVEQYNNIFLLHIIPFKK